MENKLELSFSGDVCLNGVFRDKTVGGEEIFSSEVSAFMRSSDFFVCNLEGPLSADAALTVSSPQGSIEYLAQRGVNTFCLANNHIFDAGIKGFDDTASAIDHLSLKRFGAGKRIEEASSVVYLEKNGLCVALIGMCHNEGMTAAAAKAGVFSEKDIALLGTRVTEAVARANRIIVVFHGGEEFTSFPSPPKRVLLKRIASIPGVDAVVCHHSHSLQGMERFGDKLIFYSLGNFVFDLEAHKPYANTRQSAILKFTITKELMFFNFFPIEIDGNKGCIEARNVPFDEEFKALCDFSDYQEKWETEAYNVLYNTPNAANDGQNKGTGLKSISPLLWPFHASFYRKLFGLAGDKYRRSLVNAALKHRRKRNA
ncbi:MAG: CapA family protein [Bacteroidota bacterium]